MRHAFFADTGGFMLQSPDVPLFPVDSEQLAYLVEKKYLQSPRIDEATIGDRNKADGFARPVTSVQFTWFFIQCLMRWQQRLDLSTLEITTFATILATLNSLFFWYYKPLDAKKAIILSTESRITDVLVDAGDRARKPYS
ncbi:MAG: hypothetical protein Q9209_005227 [Squamulea sp. 1 TL-2023]